MNHEDDDDLPPQTISKTRMKREMTALQKLGESLIDMPIKQYKAVPMPDVLRAAVDAAREMTKRGALHRQKQFIGRVMRDIDAEPITRALERLTQQNRQVARQFHQVERWRDRLLDETDGEAITELCRDYPAVERQPLGQKVRAARKEAATGRPAGAKRALFRFIAKLIEAQQISRLSESAPDSGSD